MHATTDFHSFIQAISQRARRASGQPISALMAKALAQPELISLAAGFVDPATLPVEETLAASRRLLESDASGRAALQYGTTIGLPELREAILARMIESDRRGADEPRPTVEQVVVSAGSNQLLALASEAILDPGDIVLCGAPSYFVYLGLLAQLDARAVGVEVDGEGMSPEALDEEFERRRRTGDLPRVKAVYVVTYYDNPCSVTLSAERRARLVEVVERWSRAASNKIYLIEDAAYRELRYDGQDAASLQRYDESGETVVCAGTFSKSFSPGVRIGWGVLPKELVEPVLALKGNFDFGTSNYSQSLMLEVIRGGMLDRHVEQIRAGYRKKLHAMLEALDEHLGAAANVRWQAPEGGLYVWLTLPEEVDAGLESRLFNLALAEGVLYVPGEYFYPADGAPARRNTIRLSFGVQSAENIRRGVKALAGAIGRVASAKAE